MAYKTRIKNKTYGLSVKICISEDFSKEEYLKESLEGDYSDCNAITFKIEGQPLEVWFSAKNIKYPAFFASVVAHECVHVVNRVYIDRGIELDKHNDEPQAYLLSFFVEQIHRHVEKYKKRKTKK